MRRTLKFLEWKSSQWVAKSPKSDRSSSSALLEGLNAYAFRQADVFTSLNNHFLSIWQGLKGLNNFRDDSTPILVHVEEEMQGIEGGDADLG